MSVVLETQPDGNYEPSESEIVEYGKWLGMQLPEDSCFLWIAREGLKAPLPEFWKACKSEKGDLYYFNFKTGTSIWDHPMDDHFRELFRQEKENPSVKSVAGGAKPKPQEIQPEDNSTPPKKSKKKRGDKEKHGKRQSVSEEPAPEAEVAKPHKDLPTFLKPIGDAAVESPEFHTAQSRATVESPDATPIAAGGGISGLKAIAKMSSPPLPSPNNSKADESPAVSPSKSAKKSLLKPLTDADDDAEKRKMQAEKEQAHQEMVESLREYKAALEVEKSRKIAEYDKRQESTLKEEQVRQQKVTEARINELKLEFENRKKVEVKKLQQNFEKDLEREIKRLEDETKATLDDFTRSKREQCEIQKEAQSQALQEVSAVGADVRRLANDFVENYSAALSSFLTSVASSQPQFAEVVKEKQKLQHTGELELKQLQEQHAHTLEAEKESHQQSLAALKEVQTQSIQALQQNHERQLAETEKQHQQALAQAAAARQEQASFAESLSKMRSEQTQELEKLKEELKAQAQSELKAVLDDVAKEKRTLAAAAVASSASGTEASLERANNSPKAASRGQRMSRSQPPPIDANLLEAPGDEQGYNQVVEPSESQRDIKTAVTEALRQVFAESPFTLASPSLGSRESPARSSRGSFAFGGQQPNHPVSIPPSYQGQKEVIDRERQRVIQGRTYVQAQRSSLEARRDDLKRRKHQWKQDVLAAKREGVRSSSARGQFLNRVRLQFEDQSRALERDEAVLRDSEMWLHMKEQRLMQLEQQIEDQAQGGGDSLLDTSALATGFFKPQRYSVTPSADRRTSYLRDPFESNTTSPMLVQAIDRIERRLDEFTSLVNLQQQGTTPNSNSRRPSLSPMHPSDAQRRGHSSRAAKSGQRESVAHIDPWTTS